jgi:hypothetical protein
VEVKHWWLRSKTPNEDPFSVALEWELGMDNAAEVLVLFGMDRAAAVLVLFGITMILQKDRVVSCKQLQYCMYLLNIVHWSCCV